MTTQFLISIHQVQSSSVIPAQTPHNGHSGENQTEEEPKRDCEYSLDLLLLVNILILYYETIQQLSLPQVDELSSGGRLQERTGAGGFV